MGVHLKFSLTLILPCPQLVAVSSSPALIASFPVYKYTNKLAPKGPNNIPRKPSFCSFASFLIVSLTPFINTPDSSRDYFHDIIHFFIRVY